MSANIEEYLEALYVLTQDRKTATTTEISHHLKITPASVTEMLKKLAERGYVNYSPYQGATLTGEGFKIGEKMTRKHRLLERFLYDILKIRKDRVHEQACKMEHTLSDETEQALCEILKQPDKCPDDQKIIPLCDFQFSSCEECQKWSEESLEKVGKRKTNLVAVSGLKEGDAGRIAFIRGDHKVLRRLLDMGLTPGTKINVTRIAPFRGPVEISVRGSKLVLGRGIVSKVFVETAVSELGDVLGTNILHS